MPGQKKTGSMNDFLSEKLEETGNARASLKHGQQHLARGSARSGAGSGSSGSGAPPSGGGGGGGSAVLVGLQHEFAADDTTPYGIQAGHLVDGARVAFDLEDASGDVEPLDGVVLLFENGVALSALLSDYSVSGNTVTFTTAPQGRISGWCLKAPASTHP